MREHTPGPWEFWNLDDPRYDGWSICKLGCPGPDDMIGLVYGTSAVSLANAALIAAAPTLYRALHDLYGAVLPYVDGPELQAAITEAEHALQDAEARP